MSERSVLQSPFKLGEFDEISYLWVVAKQRVNLFLQLNYLVFFLQKFFLIFSDSKYSKVNRGKMSSIIASFNLCRALQCNVCPKYKLAAISVRLTRVRCLLRFAPQFSKPLQYRGDKLRTNLTEIAASLHLRFSSRARGGQKLH